MDNFVPFHKMNDLEMMMINLLNEGEETLWKIIEGEPNAFKRCKQRKIYAQAIKKIKEGK